MKRVKALQRQALQAYSIIGIDDPEVKEDLKEVSGQPYVVENGYLFVFVMDYYRHAIVNENTKKIWQHHLNQQKVCWSVR